MLSLARNYGWAGGVDNAGKVYFESSSLRKRANGSQILLRSRFLRGCFLVLFVIIAAMTPANARPSGR
jgi:hypothetical protein